MLFSDYDLDWELAPNDATHCLLLVPGNTFKTWLRVAPDNRLLEYCTRRGGWYYSKFHTLELIQSHAQLTREYRVEARPKAKSALIKSDGALGWILSRLGGKK